MKQSHLVSLATFVLVATTGMSLSSQARAETWAERLGFPAGKKVIILHAHQMGLCRSTNAAAEQLQASGLVFSSSGMAPCPWFADYAKSAPGDAGLCLTINSEWPNYRWQPLAPDHDVASLTDPEGFFWKTTAQTMVNADVSEVERELKHQLIRARLAGFEPSHLTTHLGTLYTRLDFTKLYLRLAREFWIPAVVVELTPEHIERFRTEGYPLHQELIALVGEYPLPKVDELLFVQPAESYDSLKAVFVNMVNALKPGLTQVAFEPALETDELKHIVHDWEQRTWEAKLMEDPDVRKRLEADDVVLTTWSEVMKRFTGEVPGIAQESLGTDEPLAEQEELQ